MCQTNVSCLIVWFLVWVRMSLDIFPSLPPPHIYICVHISCIHLTLHKLCTLWPLRGDFSVALACIFSTGFSVLSLFSVMPPSFSKEMVTALCFGFMFSNYNGKTSQGNNSSFSFWDKFSRLLCWLWPHDVGTDGTPVRVLLLPSPKPRGYGCAPLRLVCMISIETSLTFLLKLACGGLLSVVVVLTCAVCVLCVHSLGLEGWDCGYLPPSGPILSETEFQTCFNEG